MKAGWILALGAFALGVVLGYWLRGGPETTPRAQRVRTPVRIPVAPRAEVEAPRKVVESPAAVPARTGSGVIRGSVSTKAGDPLAKVTVIATPIWKESRASYRRGRPVPAADHAEEDLRLYAERQRWMQAGERRATTDASGAYAIEGLSDETFHVTAYAKGYELRARAKTWGLRPGVTIDFVATAVFDLSVDVLLPDGARAKEAWIRAVGGDRRRRREAWSADEPRIQLDEGEYKVHAVAGESDDLRSEEQAVVLHPGETTPFLVFRLKGRPGIRGKILVPPELKPQQIIVRALRWSAEAPPPDRQILRSRISCTAEAAKDFRYELKDLQPGRYVFALSADSATVESTQIIEIPEFTLEKDLRFTLKESARRVVVRVLGPGGESVGDVGFMGHVESSRGSGVGPFAFIPRADGSYLVRVRVRGWERIEHTGDERYRLEVRSREYGRVEREFDPSGKEELLIRMGRPAELTVVIRGYAGSAMQGKLAVDLKSAPITTPGVLSIHRVDDPAGRYTFESVQPGSYELVLIRMGKRGAYKIAGVPVQVAPGANALQVPIPSLYTLKIFPESPVKNLRLGLQVIDEHGQRMVGYADLGDEGFVPFAFIPAGRYEISGSFGGKLRRRIVEVPAETEVRFP